MTNTQPENEIAPADVRDENAPGYDPKAALAECFDAWASGAWNDANAVQDLDEVMGHIERLVRAKADTADEVDAHLAAVCAEAGLESMHGVFDFVRSRGEVEVARWLAVTAEEVYDLHEAHVARAVDGVEWSLLHDD